MGSQKTTTGFGVVAACAFWAFSVTAETFEVKGEGVRFVPEIVHAKVGDVIAFRKMIPHAMESVPEMWPEGAAPARSEQGTDFDYVITEEGAYVFRCPRHWGARMAGVILVGDSADTAASIGSYFRRADADAALKPAKRLLKRLLLQQSTKYSASPVVGE